ncbi:MAG: DUF4920 domain-containing protein [Methanothrix sp.]|nr:DUF4920 domain-containing protein [Methanothrix sp.]
MTQKVLCGIIGLFALLSLAVMAVSASDSGYENVAIKDVLNKSSDYLGKGVAIEGNITRECGGRGCWITVDDGTGVLLVDLKPNNFTIPLNQVGNNAKVYGNVTLIEGKKKLTFEPGSPYVIGKKVEITGDIKQPLVSTG